MSSNGHAPIDKVMESLVDRAQQDRDERDKAVSRAMFLEAERDALRALLRDLLTFIRREAGYMAPEDQLLIGRARAMLEESRRRV
jgi:hypothetical protein